GQADRAVRKRVMQGAEACEGLRDPRTRGGNAGIDQELAGSTGEDSNIAAGAFPRRCLPHVAAMDLFVVPTIGFNLLYVLVIVRLRRRELVWINMTAHPTAECEPQGERSIRTNLDFGSDSDPAVYPK